MTGLLIGISGQNLRIGFSSAHSLDSFSVSAIVPAESVKQKHLKSGTFAFPSALSRMFGVSSGMFLVLRKYLDSA